MANPAKLSFSIRLDGTKQAPTELNGYLFDAKDRFIGSKPVNSDGRLDLEVAAESLPRARVFVAPQDATIKEPTIESMRRLGAYEPPLRLLPERLHEILIPKDIFDRWPLCMCRVTGRVVRPIEINGAIHEMPVCHARVHVCEVDPRPLIFRKIPDLQIFKLRDELLRLTRPEWPIPRPFPEPDPRKLSSRDKLRIGAEQPMLDAALPFGSMMEPLAAADREILAKMPATEMYVPPAVREALAVSTPNAIRDVLGLHAEALMPILCRWPWIWKHLKHDEIAVVETDEYGRFEARYFYNCKGDHPDIYVWVEFSIGETWTAVYKPPVSCSTRWDYKCGSEIIVRVTDPRVPWCGGQQQLPGAQIAVLTIGNGINVRQIDRASGFAPGGAPFGGSLEPTVIFGDDVHAIATHYRWSYARVASDGSVGAPTIVDGDVGRHYATFNSEGHLIIKSFNLGPDPAVSSQILYKIPPKNPPSGSWAPQTNARANTASAYFVTGTPHDIDYKLIEDGLYQLTLELFNVVGTTVTKVNGLQFKVPTLGQNAPFPTNADVPLEAAPNDYLVKNASNQVTGFTLRLLVDNNKCEAILYPVEVPGSTQECGFITYGAATMATMSFRASHPHNYAHFGFRVIRGSCEVSNDSGLRVGANHLSGYQLDGLDYDHAVTIADLTKPLPPHCPTACTRAAFAQYLTVTAMAVDGWGGLRYLDAGAIAAFALSPN